MKQTLRDERGMALALAIVALVIAGALVAGAFFVGTQEMRMGDNSRRLQQSFGVAEAGASEAIRSWNRLTYNSAGIYPNDSAKINGVSWTTMPNNTGSYGGYVYKLNNNMYLLSVTGRDTMSLAGRIRSGGARQRIGILARIRPLQIDIAAALTVGGKITFGGGNVYVKGQDTPPVATGWSCPAADATLAGVRAMHPGDVTNSEGQVTGSPPVFIDATLSAATFTQFGATNYDDLAAQASITLPAGTYSPNPVVLNGACNTAINTNWGDGNNRTNPCGNYFPIIHITGAATQVNNGQGQGILLVDGDLNAGGSFTWYGIVIVRGSFDTIAGGSVKIYGSLMAQALNLTTTAFNGDAVINYSKCAVVQALQWTGVTSMTRSRSWVQLY